MPTNKKQAEEALRAATQKSAEESEKEIEDLIQQVLTARTEVETAVLKLSTASLALRDRVRRFRTDVGTQNRLVFANAYMRLSAAFAQGVKRVSTMNRMLDRVKVEQEEARRHEHDEAQWKLAREAKKQATKLVEPSESAFDDVYGEVI
jgi:uncharacterized protein YgbK (DUF1537 family)